MDENTCLPVSETYTHKSDESSSSRRCELELYVCDS